MAKGNFIVVLSSDDEDNANNCSLSLSSSYTNSRPTNSTRNKRARLSGSRSRNSKDYGKLHDVLYKISLLRKDFNEELNGFKILKGARERSYGLINTSLIHRKSSLFIRKRLNKLRYGLRKG